MSTAHEFMCPNTNHNCCFYRDMPRRTAGVEVTAAAIRGTCFRPGKKQQLWRHATSSVSKLFDIFWSLLDVLRQKSKDHWLWDVGKKHGVGAWIATKCCKKSSEVHNSWWCLARLPEISPNAEERLQESCWEVGSSMDHVRNLSTSSRTQNQKIFT